MDFAEIGPGCERAIEAVDGCFVAAQRGQRISAVCVCRGEVGPQRDRAVVACDRLLEAAPPLERDTAVAPALKEIRANGKRTIIGVRSEEHTSELQSLRHLVCRLLLEK